MTICPSRRSPIGERRSGRRLVLKDGKSMSKTCHLDEHLNSNQIRADQVEKYAPVSPSCVGQKLCSKMMLPRMPHGACTWWLRLRVRLKPSIIIAIIIEAEHLAHVWSVKFIAKSLIVASNSDATNHTHLSASMLVSSDPLRFLHQ